MIFLNKLRDYSLEHYLCMCCGRQIVNFSEKRDFEYYHTTAVCEECHKEQLKVQADYDWDISGEQDANTVCRSESSTRWTKGGDRSGN